MIEVESDTETERFIVLSLAHLAKICNEQSRNYFTQLLSGSQKPNQSVYSDETPKIKWQKIFILDF